MGYTEDIEEEARDFIEEYEEEIAKALSEGTDFHDIKTDCGDFSDLLREKEFYFSLEDAVVVIRECKADETDSGLWEGQEPEEALVTKAVYSALSDLYNKTEEIFDELKGSFGMQERDLEEGEDSEELALKVVKEWFKQFEVKPLKKGSTEEKDALETWLNVNKHIGIRGGYPLGSSYIDSRCGSGYSNDSEQANYIDFDRKTAKLVPHLSGKYRREIEDYFKKKFK